MTGAGPRLAVIGDDLTGTLDAAAPFAARGASVQVALNPSALQAALAAAPEVVAVSTDSREIAPEAAQAAVRAVVRALPPGTPVFKKIDSRLKGHVAAELSALEFRRMLVAPAIPDFGRIVTGGALQGFGVDTPIDVAAVLGPHAGRAEIPDTPDAAGMTAALAGSDADLLVGARGLAEALAARLLPAPPQAVTRLPGPRALVVVGSRDPITIPQVQALRRIGVAVAEAPNGAVEPAPDTDILVVQATPGTPDLPPAEVARRLAEGIVPRMTEGRQLLLLTGGATAAAVLDRLGVERLHLLGECLPGLPVCRAGGFTVVTKSGGFGSPETLVTICRLVNESSQAGPRP
ncbi:four-carbon acid sugar kinase family protein [Paracoccus sp. (in: a-proteobacteria)]|uniref:four-carbon acid sugar kinase family protein n=1 Tax=Paracoccus sp. TaxID=267 RepID=UPI0026DF6F88|nr:four-carbon acid sugar kinase family protein [Paracoccus sp. (in: a-proteobacteria)]MDO5371458.1 four-carbon acid sugar kinase family protein [Paracoccus sp. (in: a-proteobacteria)]